MLSYSLDEGDGRFLLIDDAGKVHNSSYGLKLVSWGGALLKHGAPEQIDAYMMVQQAKLFGGELPREEKVKLWGDHKVIFIPHVEVMSKHFPRQRKVLDLINRCLSICDFIRYLPEELAKLTKDELVGETAKGEKEMVIKNFRGEYRFLSNFYPSPLTTPKGTRCSTVEHAYQAAKTANPLEQAAVLNCATPGDAKRAGRTVTLRPNWEQVKLKVMEKLLTYKFNQNPDLAEKLANTFPHVLVEGNTWHDAFWGKCYCSKHRGEGSNHLGMLLMKVRESLR